MSEPVVLLRPRNVAELATALRKEVGLEVRLSGLAHEPSLFGPLPAPIDEEQEIVGAVLDAHVTVEELAPLESKHFFADVFRAIWNAACDSAPGDLDGIRAKLTAAGWRGALDRELENLALGTPFVCVPRLRQHVERVIDCWRRRQLIEATQRLNVELRRDHTTLVEALALFEQRREAAK